MSAKIIVANWKMNPLTEKEAKEISKGVAKASKKNPKTKVVICPPSIFLKTVQDSNKTKQYITGLQNIYPELQGSHTGEISADMARAMNVHYVIAGHSERRAAGETDEDVNKKVLAIVNAKMMPIICVGEHERDSEVAYLQFIQNEITIALEGLNENQVAKCVIAYEPLWAIGKSDKEAMVGSDMYEMYIFIKKVINDLHGARVAKKVSILYGGSVSPINAEDILEEGHVDGLLVGRQSLYPENFGKIITIAEGIK
jgi:triosephosphate isomerase (TIM)